MPTAEWNFGLISEKRKMNKTKTPAFVGVFYLIYFVEYYVVCVERIVQFNRTVFNFRC